MRFSVSNDRKGFTLIELVMVITLLGIIGGIIALPLYQGTKGWFEATTREGITESGRIAIERMMREIRNTSRTAANAPCISSATGTVIRFSDINGDLTNCNSTEFSLSGSNIQRITRVGGIITETANLADNIQNPPLFTLFTYYDNTNVPTAVVANVRRVGFEIVSTSGGETLRKYSEVYLSNMKGY